MGNISSKFWIIAAIIALIVISAGILVYNQFKNSSEVEFKEKDGLLIIENTHYEIAFDSTHGGISFLRDKRTEEMLSTGNRNDNLWWAYFNDDSVTDSSTSDNFSYEWNSSEYELVFQYDGDLNVNIVTMFTEEDRFSMKASVENNSEATVSSFQFPYELEVKVDQIADALLPMLPGVKLNDDFFKGGNSYSEQYPGIMFSPYLALQTDNGELSIYDVNNSSIATVDIGYKYQGGNENTTGIVHNYKTWIDKGKDWETPKIIVQIGGDYEESILNFRNDNKMDEYNSLVDKLGEDKDQYYASPLYKLDVGAIHRDDMNWGSLKENWLDRIDQRGMIHLVAFQQGGHDENYPDFLPPTSKWGAFDEFLEIIQYAKGLGNLVVPYTNFSWWGVNSPTLNESLPENLTLEDLVIQRENGSIIEESYASKHGYVMNPDHPFVKERIAEEHQKLLEAGFDGVFEDQWGIRNTPYVFNEEIPEHSDPSNAYTESVRNYLDSADHNMYVEDGFDFMANDLVGFMGTTLLWDKLGYRTNTTPFTEYYPMIGMLARDKVMLFHHDLAAETMTDSLEMLRWNLAMGYNLSVDLLHGTDNPWIDVVGVFQKHVLADYVDQRVESYEQITPTQTLTKMGDYQVTANWDDENELDLDNQFVLSPGGVQVVSSNENIRAGVFSSYNGKSLDTDEHYFVEIRADEEITLYQPNGADTTIAIEKGEDWTHARVIAYQYDGTEIAELPVTEEENLVTFDYISDIYDEKVGYIQIIKSEEPSDISDVPFEKQRPIVDMAFNQPIESSSNTTPDFPAESANNGDPYTYWESAPNQFPQTLTVDLGEVQPINEVILRLPPSDAWGSRDQEIEILISDDGNDFTILLPAENYTFNPDLGNLVEITLESAETRYVQLVITNNTDWTAAQVAEFKVY